MSEVAGPLRRILLPLDVSRDSLAAQGIALDLAAALGGEVVALFIEDTRLLAAANLPFTREVGSLSGITRQVGFADVERLLRGVADKARAALRESSQRLNVRSSFRVERGDVTGGILAATMEIDLIVLGKRGWSLGQFGEPGNTCRDILSKSPAPTLVVEHGVMLTTPILAVDDGSPAGKRAADIAKQIGRALHRDVVVFPAKSATKGEIPLEETLGKPGFVVLPASSFSHRDTSRLKCPVLFVP